MNTPPPCHNLPTVAGTAGYPCAVVAMYCRMAGFNSGDMWRFGVRERVERRSRTQSPGTALELRTPGGGPLPIARSLSLHP